MRIPGYLAYWREHESSTSIAFRGLAMANERIKVIQEFLEKNSNLPTRLKKMAISSAYYQAALLVYFDQSVPGKGFLYRAFLSYPANVLKFNWKIIIYIALTPFSGKLLKALRFLGFFGKMPKNA
jgi:uncharacterized membrane protein YbaN (DUF454 family)